MEERTFFPRNTIDVQMEKNEFIPLSHTPHKINSKWITDLNGRAKTIKLLEGNSGVDLCDLALGNDFLGMTPKV